MKRLLVTGLALALLTLAGCAQTDPGEEVVNKVLASVQNAKSTLDSVKAKLTKTVEDAEKNNNKIQIKDLAPALKEAERLGDVGDQMLKWKVDADALKDKITPEQQKELDSKFAGQLQSYLDQLYKAQEDLERTARRVEDLATPEAVEKMHEALQQSREKFVILTRRK